MLVGWDKSGRRYTRRYTRNSTRTARAHARQHARGLPKPLIAATTSWETNKNSSGFLGRRLGGTTGSAPLTFLVAIAVVVVAVFVVLSASIFLCSGPGRRRHHASRPVASGVHHRLQQHFRRLEPDSSADGVRD